MQQFSTPVASAQLQVHSKLAEVVQRHLSHADRTPVAQFSLQQWPQLQHFLHSRAKFILDLGCGTGESSLHLARAHPDCSVLGVDRSSARLEHQLRDPKTTSRRESGEPTNLLHARADSHDVLRLCQQFDMRAERISLLYPNPSPKPKHLLRRWHGHPIWPGLLACTGEIELRCNWQLYAEEFAFALNLSGWSCMLERYHPEAAQTAFERKYAASGHALWRVLGYPSPHRERAACKSVPANHQDPL